MNVGRPLVGRFHENLVHESNDGRLLRGLRHLAVVGLQRFEELDIGVVGGLLGERRDGVAADPEVLLDEPGDLAGRGQYGHHVQAGERLEFVQRVRVERVAGGDDEGAVVPGDGHQVFAVDELLRHHRQHVPLDGGARQVDEFQPELLREHR